MKLSLISLVEATTPWMGEFEPVLGSGEPYTLNFGGAQGRPPMLYVPIPLSRVRTAINAIRRGAITPEAPLDGDQPPPSPRLTHVGEAHVTISMGPELGEALGVDPVQALSRTGLFDGRSGVPVQVRHTGKYSWFKAGFYKDDMDPAGPWLVAELVEVPEMRSIRSSLGMSPLPKVPGVAVYKPHITVGYLPKSNNIHKSYVLQYGASHRRSSRKAFQ